MIKKLEAKEIVKIKNIDKDFPCEVGQYIQFLISHINTPQIKLIGNMDGDKLTCYALLIHNDLQPIANSIVVQDIWSLDHKSLRVLANEAEKWKIQVGAQYVMAAFPDDEKHNEKYVNSFGLKANKIANVYMFTKE